MLLTGNPYSLMFMIGFIALVGIVVNNAIILIDSANENMKRSKHSKVRAKDHCFPQFPLMHWN